MSPIDNLFMLFCAGFVGSCSSPRPGAVDRENLAVDVDACISAGASCMQSGATPVESFFAGQQAVFLPVGARIVAPLVAPTPTAKLAHLVVAVNSKSDPTKSHHLAVTVSGLPIRATCGSISPVPGACISPLPSFTRTEIDERPNGVATTPPAGATVTIETVDGDGFDVLWVVGRWED